MTHVTDVNERVDRLRKDDERRLLLCVVILLAYLLLGCAELPPTKVPVCSEQRGVVCHAPAKPYVWRDLKWERAHVCPAGTDLTLRACYRFAGVKDGRQLYVYQSPDGDDNP